MLISNNNYSSLPLSSTNSCLNPSTPQKKFVSRCNEVGQVALDELQKTKKDLVSSPPYYAVETRAFDEPTNQLPKFKFFIELETPSSPWMSIGRIEDRIQIQMPTRKKEQEEYKKTFKETDLLYVFHNTVNDKYLIGKTNRSFIDRCREHLNDAVNYLDFKENQKVIDRQFLEDLHQNPQHFQVALLYKKENDEDLEDLEISAIEAKRQIDPSEENKWPLYNSRGGGGGGRAHPKNQNAEYIIPKDIKNYTPDKYFSYTQDKKKRIVIKQIDEFKKFVNHEHVKKTLDFSSVDSTTNKAYFYCIKNLKSTDQRYIGVTCNPITRAHQHGSDSLKTQIANKIIKRAKTRTRKGSLLHQTLANKTHHMAIGVFKYISSKDIVGKEKKYHVFTSVAAVEKHLITAKNAHKRNGGLNQREGGGGSYPVSKKQKIKL
jgi:hypothetical protein